MTYKVAPKTTTSFKTTRISKTTFLVTEDDKYGEQPFIYAKQHPDSPILILSDTGCNAPNKKVKVSNLRQYLETYPIPDLDGEPINPLIKDADGNVYPERKYIVICTHCHYDHIGGIEAFVKPNRPDSTCAWALSAANPAAAIIVASGYDKDFLKHDLKTHFLGGFKDPPIPLPKYKVTYWAHDGGRLYATHDASKDPTADLVVHQNHPTLNTAHDHRDVDLRIRFVLTPGHTPDSLTWYDEAEMCLYTGDSFYERSSLGLMPIIFPKEGNLTQFNASLAKMLRLVRRENEKAEREMGVAQDDEECDAVIVPKRVKIGAAHQTFGRDAEEMLLEVCALFRKIAKGDVPIVYTVKVRGEDNSLWLEGPKAKYMVFMPNRLLDESKKAR